MAQETEQFILIEPDDYFRMDTEEGRLGFLAWLERCLADGHEFVEMLPGGFALFRKTPNANSKGRE